MAKQQVKHGNGRIVLTKAMAFASGEDAANRQMRAAGRTAWSREDADLAANETLRLMVAGGHLPLEQAVQCGYENPDERKTQTAIDNYIDFLSPEVAAGWPY